MGLAQSCSAVFPVLGQKCRSSICVRSRNDRPLPEIVRGALLRLPMELTEAAGGDPDSVTFGE